MCFALGAQNVPEECIPTTLSANGRELISGGPGHAFGKPEGFERALWPVDPQETARVREADEQVRTDMQPHGEDHPPPQTWLRPNG